MGAATYRPVTISADDPRIRKALSPNKLAKGTLKAYRAKRRNPCLVCDGTDQCIAGIPSKAITGAPPGFIYTYCIRAAGRSDGIPVQWGFRDEVRLFVFNEDETVIELRPSAHEQQVPTASPELIDAVLRYTAQRLGLSEQHRAALISRGYKPEAIGNDEHAQFLFATLPADLGPRYQLVLDLMYRGIVSTTRELLGVRGFGYRVGRPRQEEPVGLLVTKKGSALIEFIRGEQGHIRGFMYAPDERGPKGPKGPKRKFPDDFTLNGMYHVARPSVDEQERIFYTEGQHKANLTAEHERNIAIALLGVGNYRNALVAARSLDPDQQLLHVAAMDNGKAGQDANKKLFALLKGAGYRVATATWDESVSGPDDAILAGLPITVVEHATTRKPDTQDVRVPYVYGWMRSAETPAERAAMFDAAGAEIANLIREHVAQQPDEVLVIATPPGFGKTKIAASLGVPSTTRPDGEINWAWYGENHDMIYAVPELGKFNHIYGANRDNCPNWEVFGELASKGFRTVPLHLKYCKSCRYLAQFEHTHSAFLQLAHLRTTLHKTQIIPGSAVLREVKRDAFGIDELDLGRWISDQIFTLDKLSSAAAAFSVESYAALLLGALQAVITDAQRDGQDKGGVERELHGRPLFDALDARLCGRLSEIIGNLNADKKMAHAMNPRPFVDIDPNDPDALERVRNEIKPVVLPHVWRPLAVELAKWQRGEDWTSRCRVGPINGTTWAFIVLDNLSFPEGEAARIGFDATADVTIDKSLFQRPVCIVRKELPPPPHMRHVAVRTGKRYGKMTLTRGKNADSAVARVAAEVKYLLRDLDPDGTLLAAGKVGLITYLDIEHKLGDLLGIPETNTLHFFAARGKNTLEACEILFVIGTPQPRPEDIVHMARVIYAGEQRLDEVSEETPDGWKYRDARVQHVADVVTNAELTQCAHRNRPLRHDGRTVVTMTTGQVDFLPVTLEIKRLPHLAANGERATLARAKEREQRLRQAVETLAQRGEKITVRALVAEAHIDQNLAAKWLREQRETQKASGTTPSGNNSSDVMNSPINISYWEIHNIGDNFSPPPAAVEADPPVAPAATAPTGLPTWQDARRIAGWGASDERVHEVWMRLIYEQRPRGAVGG